MTATERLKVGAFIPQGWKLEYTGVDAASAWSRSKEISQLAERIGYDHLWVYDHVETVPRREPTHVFEAYTMLAAIAQHTTRVGLGQLVTCAAYRNPGLLAKTAACIDVLSEGRLVFGIGAGWYKREYEAYGFDFPSAGTRLAILDESLEVIKRMWSEESVSFAGKHFAFDGAYCDPKPLQNPPPIWVGGGGERKTLRIAAQHASHTNWQVGLPAFEHKSKVLAQHCADIGRDFDSISRTHGPDCRLFDSEADLKRWLDSPGGGSLWGGTPHDEYVANHLVGTVEQVTEQLLGFIAAGCREVVLWFRDYPSSESLERFMAEVVPNLA